MGLFDIFKKKKKESNEIVPTRQLAIAEEDKGLSVLLESLPATFDESHRRLIEITEPAVLARIDALIPSAGMASVNVGNIVRQSKETLYKVVLKNGGKLVGFQNYGRSKTRYGNGQERNCRKCEFISGRT